jgi:high-affinity Fe2+/Pb2+ permease
MTSDPNQRISPVELRLLINDKYTAAELVDRLDLTIEEVLDSFMDEVYDNLRDLWEIHDDIGMKDDGTNTQDEETYTET